MDHDHDLTIPVSKRKKTNKTPKHQTLEQFSKPSQIVVFGCRRDSQEQGVNVATLNRALREQAWLGPLWGGVCAHRHHLGGEEGKEEQREPAEGAARVSG